MLAREMLKKTTIGSYLAECPIRPRSWKRSLAAAKLLLFGYGHLKSVHSRSSVDAGGQPIPWFTYPAIEFLQQLDISGKTVFEYGSGNSTLFWAARADRVVSVEDEEHWSNSLIARVPANCTVLQEADLRHYVDAIHQYPEGFDIIVVDGPSRGHTRLKCARAAVEHLKPGGMIILDNSDWLPQSARVLREADLLQVDMSGFIPVGDHTQTTSFFFHRECRFASRSHRQPQPSIGAVHEDWETIPPASGAWLDWEGERIYGVLRQEVLEKDTPDGSRRFEVAVYDHPARPRSRSRQVLVYDHARQRILLGPYVIAPTAEALNAEVARLRDMSWTAFRDFARRPDCRHYLLE